MTDSVIMDALPGEPTLSDLDDAARQRRFEALQDRMQAVWNAMKLDLDDESVVIVPSIATSKPAPGVTQAYEERFLFLLLLLRQPRLRMIYVTSMPINPRVIEYYLALLPGVIPSHALARLTLVSTGDPSDRPLSEKLLERPRLLARIAAHIPNRSRCHLIPYSTTADERDIALALGIPMYGADPRLADLGSKTGCRRLFAECGVVHPLGAEDLHSLQEVTDAIGDMLAVRPSISQVIIKTNEGVSGSGNALVDLAGIVDLPESERRSAIGSRVRAMQLESSKVPLDMYVAKFEQGGGIVEERIVGEELRSPSVQLRARPDGSVELLSTHDQLLGGASGQSYLGCTFPADPAYAAAITRDAAKVGDLLRDAGVVGRFALDFVVTRENDSAPWETYAIEINLRKGGTTHPFLTLQFLTGGAYDPESASFATPNGRKKFLVASDHVESPRYRGFTPDDLFDIVVRRGLHFGQVRQTGVVFHMLSALGSAGCLGLTAVGDTPEEARAIFEKTEAALEEEARFDQF